jgi:subtilisin family serine protease
VRCELGSRSPRLRVHRELTQGQISCIPAALLVRLAPLMERSSGSSAIGIGLVDGPVALDHPDLAGRTSAVSVGTAPPARDPPARRASTARTWRASSWPGAARRRPGICPGCTLLVRPIFHETKANGTLSLAMPDEVGQAIVECVNAGARIVNLSAATGEPTIRTEARLRQALDHAVRRGALVVAAAGNQSALGSSDITRHPGVIPVVGDDLAGRPMDQSNFGRSTGNWGAAHRVRTS